jgi:hypothetical protein
MNVAAFAEIQPPPIEIDPRPCELCGRTIDQHECFDDGEGPEFVCYPEGDLVQEWELADPRDRWKHTGEPPPPDAVRNADIPSGLEPIRQHYRTPQATVDAFRFLVAHGDLRRLKTWLADRPKDAPFLVVLLERQADA